MVHCVIREIDSKSFWIGAYELHNCCNTGHRQAIDHIINSAAKSNYMSAGQINVPIVFRGPNSAAAGVGSQHSQAV
ncbi:hypothetical protein MKX03_012502 [Papaver bracteatum]|nr:hypothetical protein MKX03_012502 [Papaver bracteatum]